MTEKILGTWCPECGPGVQVDEDWLCISCGGNAVGDGANRAIEALREMERLKKAFHFAIMKVAYSPCPPNQDIALCDANRECYECWETYFLEKASRECTANVAEKK